MVSAVFTPHYTPSREEIRRECERIRSTWSPEEHARRAPWAYQHCEVYPLEIANTAFSEHAEFHR